jgi:hypothetical protein
MKEACEASEWDPLVVLRNYNELIEIVDVFFTLGKPVLKHSAFVDSETPFIPSLCLASPPLPQKLANPAALTSMGFFSSSCSSTYWVGHAFLDYPVDAALQLIRGAVLPFLADAPIYGPQCVNFPTDSMGTVYTTGIQDWVQIECLLAGLSQHLPTHLQGNARLVMFHRIREAMHQPGSDCRKGGTWNPCIGQRALGMSL